MKKKALFIMILIAVSCGNTKEENVKKKSTPVKQNELSEYKENTAYLHGNTVDTVLVAEYPLLYSFRNEDIVFIDSNNYIFVNSNQKDAKVIDTSIYVVDFYPTENFLILFATYLYENDSLIILKWSSLDYKTTIVGKYLIDVISDTDMIITEDSDNLSGKDSGYDIIDLKKNKTISVALLNESFVLKYSNGNLVMYDPNNISSLFNYLIYDYNGLLKEKISIQNYNLDWEFVGSLKDISIYTYNQNILFADKESNVFQKEPLNKFYNYQIKIIHNKIIVAGWVENINERRYYFIKKQLIYK